jgi:hypothetical protein
VLDFVEEIGIVHNMKNVFGSAPTSNVAIGQRVGGLMVQYADMDDSAKRAFRILASHVYGNAVSDLLWRENIKHDLSTDVIMRRVQQDDVAPHVLFFLDINSEDKTPEHIAAVQSVETMCEERGHAFVKFSIGEDPQMGHFAAFHTHIPSRGKVCSDTLSLVPGSFVPTVHGKSDLKDFLYLQDMKPAAEHAEGRSATILPFEPKETPTP